MVLVLSVLRCPDHASAEQRRVTGGECVLGRGADCDWPLLDPDRVLSKRHCAVEYLAGGWQVRDLSTNGTYVNAASDAIGRDCTQALHDGDRLRLGAYEIEGRSEAEADHGEGRWSSPAALPDPMAEPMALASDIFSAPLPGLWPAGVPPGGHGPLLPLDFDPFADDSGPVMPDHRPNTNDVFTPPRALMPDLLPDDWDLSAATPKSSAPPDFVGPAPQPAPEPEDFLRSASVPSTRPLPDPFAEAPPHVAPEALPPAASYLPPLPDLLAEVAPPAVPPAIAASPPGAALPDPFAEAPVWPPAAAQADTPPPPAAGDLRAALALVFQAAGLGAPHPSLDPATSLAAAGVGLRAALGGIRALLIARADVKREFRIEQTMLRAAGNNAVKFAPTDEAAVLALLGQAGGAGALREMVQDLSAHQVATLAATQAAARALLTRLAPGPLEEQTPSSILPGAREKRLWEAYRKLHQQVSDQFEDNFDSAFGKAFARAYEEAAREGR